MPTVTPNSALHGQKLNKFFNDDAYMCDNYGMEQDEPQLIIQMQRGGGGGCSRSGSRNASSPTLSDRTDDTLHVCDDDARSFSVDVEWMFL